MRDIVELSDDAVVVVWAQETVGVLDLGTEMTEDNDSRLVRSDQ